jgi:hypothetical protein
MKIGGHPIDLMMDKGAEHSVVTQSVGPFTKAYNYTSFLAGPGWNSKTPDRLPKYGIL